MNNRLIVILPALLAAGSVGGCGNANGLYPVQGTVRHQGQPAAGAVVYFHREGEALAPSASIPFGVVDDDGQFRVSCDSEGDGCPPGKYAVLVAWPDPSKPGTLPVKKTAKTKAAKLSRVRSGQDRLGGRYFDLAKPQLHVEVLPQTNNLAPFELGG